MRVSLADFSDRIEVFHNRRTGVRVFRAKDRDGRDVALKLLPREEDPEARAYQSVRLELELRAASIVHEHVRPLLGFGDDPESSGDYPHGVDWLAFSWVEGETLRSFLSRKRGTSNPGVSARELRDLTRAIANGLAALHNTDPPWIHRDVKPENILLPNGSPRDALLSDMGIAWQVASPRLTHTIGAGAVGTLLYMAPEQFDERSELSPAVDQYALALVVWECASGEVPYNSGASAGDVFRARSRAEPLPDLHVDGLPVPCIRRVLERALGPSSETRWPSVGEFWRQLHSAGVADGVWDQDISVGALEASPFSAENRAPIPLALQVRSDFDLVGVWIEQEGHLREFQGRTRTLNFLRSWLRGEGSEQYLLLTGPPGQGKSALMAALAAGDGATRAVQVSERRNVICLYHSVKAHGDPRRLLQFLIAQADRASGKALPIDAFQGSLSDLRESLHRRLSALLASYRRVSILIDGIDEMPADVLKDNFMPSQLPDGVRCIVTCRPDAKILSTFQAQLRSAQVVPLESLDREDVELILEGAFRHDRESIACVIDVGDLMERTDSSPLLLRYAIREIGPDVQRELLRGGTSTVSLASVGTTFAVVHASAYEYMVGDQAEQIMEERRLTAECLACARTMLTVRELSQVLALGDVQVPQERVGRHLKSMSQVLREADGGYTLFHTGLRDYIRREIMGDKRTFDVEGWFIRWCEASAQGKVYYRQHVVDHLFERWRIAESRDKSTRHDALSALIATVCSMTYVATWIQAGDPFAPLNAIHRLLDSGLALEELKHVNVDDLQRYAAWIEFLRTNGHRLARRPHLLSQQLQNSGQSVLQRDNARDLADRTPKLIEVAALTSREFPRRLVATSPLLTAPEALALSPGGHQVVVLDACRELSMWDLVSGAFHRAGKDRSPQQIWPGMGAIWWWHSRKDKNAGGELLRCGPDQLQLPKICWPSAAKELQEGIAWSGGVFCCFTCEVEGKEIFSLERYDDELQSWRTIGRVNGQPSALSCSPDGKYVALCTNTYDEDVYRVTSTRVVVYRSSDGRIECDHCFDRRALDIRYLSVGIYAVAFENRLEFWSAPNLRHLWSVEGKWHTATILPHDRDAKLLLIGDWESIVVDLDSRSVVRREEWAERPARPMLLSRDGRTVVGVRTNEWLGYGDDRTLGMWSLPDDFWKSPTDDDLTSLSNPLDTRWLVGRMSGGRSVFRLKQGALAIYESTSISPYLVLYGPGIAQYSRTVELSDNVLFAYCDCSASVIDLRSANCVKHFAIEGVRLADAVPVEAGIRFSWRKSEPSDATDDSQLTSHAIDCLQRKSIDVHYVGFPPEADRIVLSDPSDSAVGPIETEWGVALLDVEVGGWFESANLPSSGDELPIYMVELAHDGECVAMSDAGDRSFLVEARTGARLYDLGDYVRPLKVLPEGRVLSADSDGRVFLVDGRKRTRKQLALRLPDAAVFSGIGFDLSPDERLAVWNSPEGIVVIDVVSGEEVALYPNEDWHGDLTFIGDRLIFASSRGRRLTLQLVGV